MTNLSYCYDLHCHSTASDGTFSPAQLMQRAVDNQVNVLALTDHDTIKGLAAAHQYIEQHHLPLHLINGVEISTYWKSTEIHIVGLNINTASQPLNALLIAQENQRIERAKEIAYKLKKVSIDDAYAQAQIYAQGDIVSRAHFARFLIANGYVKDMKHAFKKYLGKSGYAYVAPKWTTIEEAIAVIHQANGQAVLAHPSRYDFTLSKMRTLIAYFKLQAGDAIEVSQSRQTIDELNILAKCAVDFDLLASQGSDFHDAMNYLDLGKTQPLPQSVTPIWHNWTL
ncbi:PHP domain-containing protein [Orbus sturtevantii]|uniref:PHP domain-containing protein n=1 Tax=Orbus sturtevantii TaxID=3074109 RepID=UPI00370D0666